MNCQIQVVHKLTKRGTQGAVIQAIVPLGKNQAKLEIPADYVRRKDREPQKKPAQPAEEFQAADEDVPF